MKVVGLTGGIGSGKTFVSEILKKMGAYVLDADEIAKKLVSRNEAAWVEIVKHFGEIILLSDGNIDRKKLGEIVFNNPEALQKLNSIIHPGVIQRFAEVTEKLKKAKTPPQVLVYDVPLLLETDMDKTVDLIVLVYLTEDIQRERLKRRDGLSEKEIAARLSAQMPMEEKKKFADYIVDNSGSISETEKKVEKLWEILLLA